MKKILIVSGSLILLSLGIFTFLNNDSKNTIKANTNNATCNIDSSKNSSDFTDEFNIYMSYFFSKDCKEDFNIKYATPRVGDDEILAGTPFSYPVTSSSKVSCTVTQKVTSIPKVNHVSVPSPTYRQECSVTGSVCDEPEYPDEDPSGPVDPPITGPTEDFEKCILKCDGGEYSQGCIDKCTNEVYNKKMNLLDLFKMPADNLFNKVNNNYKISKVIDPCDCPYCKETISCHDVLTNGAEIEAAHALNRSIDDFNSRVDAIISKFNSATGGKYSLSSSYVSYNGSFPDLSSYENGINDYNSIPSDPAPRNPVMDMTINSDTSKDNRSYQLSLIGGIYKIPNKSVINAITGEVVEIKNGEYPNFPYYDLTDEMKQREAVDKEGYNYFTSSMAKTTKLNILSNGFIDINSRFSDGLTFNNRSIKVAVSVGGNNKLNITCGYDITNRLMDNNGKGIQIMYRPINFDSVFPDRNPRWNWRSKQAELVLKNQTKFGNNVYDDSNLDYQVLLTKDDINNIRKLGDNYFINGAYTFKLVDCLGNDISTCKSQLINKDGQSFIKRGNN